jgi:hypothetical protein
VLEADKRSWPAAHHELSCIRRPDANHKDNVNAYIDVECLAAPIYCFLRQSYDVGAVEHGTEIASICKQNGPHDIIEVRTIRIKNVVVPVCL